MDMKKLLDTLVEAEGLVLHVYKDSLGYDTIGVGHLIKDSERESFKHGITKEQAIDLLRQDVEHMLPKLSIFPWYASLDEVRQRVIAEMAFNLGIQGLTKFSKTCHDISVGNYLEASKDMLESMWAKQVKGRAVRLSHMMATGEDISA